MDSLTIKDERAQLKNRALDIIDTCKKEVRDLTPAETQELETIKAQIKEKDDELRDLNERLQNLKFEDEGKEERTENNKSNITQKMNKRFSLLKAIRSIANNQPLDDVSMAVINAGKEEARKAGVNAQGQIQLPTEERASVTVTAEGEDVVATELFDILTPLRAKNVLVQAGAKFLTGLVGNVQYPTMTKSNVAWEGETTTASDGAPTFDHITLSPKRITAYVDISKMLIAQDSIGVENAIREDLVKAVNAKIEETVLGDAAGTTTKPEGIFKTIEPDTVSSYADICDKEADIEDANVYGECCYIMSNKAKAALRCMIKGTNATGMVYEGGEVDGTRAYNTSNVSGTQYVYGDFSNLAIGSWGGVDLTVDPYTKAADGQIRLVVNMYVDAQILREEAFATGEISTD